MCIGIPMQVLSVAAGVAICEGRGRREQVGTLLVDDVTVGGWLLVYHDSAVRAMTADEAQATDAALDALEAAIAGEVDLDRYFPDLARREPELPPHLAGREK